MIWFVFAILTAVGALYMFAPLAQAGKLRAAYGLTALFGGLALGLYLWLGNPDLPPAPAAPRQTAQKAALAQIAAGADKLRQALAADPGDAQGWALLAKSESALGHDEAAAVAYDRAAALTDGETADDLRLEAKAARIAQLYKAGKVAWARGDRAAMEANWRPLLDLLPDEAPLRGELLQKLDAPR